MYKVMNSRERINCVKPVNLRKMWIFLDRGAYENENAVKTVLTCAEILLVQEIGPVSVLGQLQEENNL